MSNQTKQKTPKNNLEFKQDAAKLVKEKNYTHQGRWVRAEREPATVTSEASSVLNLGGQAELRRLQEENDQLRMEREILKKAAIFFAKEIE